MYKWVTTYKGEKKIVCSHTAFYAKNRKRILEHESPIAWAPGRIWVWTRWACTLILEYMKRRGLLWTVESKNILELECGGRGRIQCRRDGMWKRIRRQKRRQEDIRVLCEVKQTLKRPWWWLPDRPHNQNVPYVIWSLLLCSLMTPKLSVQVLKHRISIVTLFWWLLGVGGEEAHPGVGGSRREGVVPTLGLCQNRNKRTAPRCRESIRKQEIRAKLTVNLTGILGTWFGLQRHTKWEFCAAHLCQVPEGQEVPANTWDTLRILPERSFFLSVMAFGSQVPWRQEFSYLQEHQYL